MLILEMAWILEQKIVSATMELVAVRVLRVAVLAVREEIATASPTRELTAIVSAVKEETVAEGLLNNRDST